MGQNGRSDTGMTPFACCAAEGLFYLNSEAIA